MRVAYLVCHGPIQSKLRELALEVHDTVCGTDVGGLFPCLEFRLVALTVVAAPNKIVDARSFSRFLKAGHKGGGNAI